jgi:hypothetical protein
LFTKHRDNLGVSSVEKDINLYNMLELESEKEVGEWGGLNRIGENTIARRRVGRTWRKKALRSLCGELMEEVFDESSFPLNSDLMISTARESLTLSRA